MSSIRTINRVKSVSCDNSKSSPVSNDLPTG
jgi:hypothetical protein